MSLGAVGERPAGWPGPEAEGAEWAQRGGNRRHVSTARGSGLGLPCHGTQDIHAPTWASIPSPVQRAPDTVYVAESL